MDGDEFRAAGDRTAAAAPRPARTRRTARARCRRSAGRSRPSRWRGSRSRRAGAGWPGRCGRGSRPRRRAIPRRARRGRAGAAPLLGRRRAPLVCGTVGCRTPRRAAPWTSTRVACHSSIASCGRPARRGSPAIRRAAGAPRPRLRGLRGKLAAAARIAHPIGSRSGPRQRGVPSRHGDVARGERRPPESKCNTAVRSEQPRGRRRLVDARRGLPHSAGPASCAGPERPAEGLAGPKGAGQGRNGYTRGLSLAASMPCEVTARLPRRAAAACLGGIHKEIRCVTTRSCS